MRARWILLAMLCTLAPGTAWSQTMADATMTLFDHDGNGFASIGDEVQVSVVVDGAVTGTSVRIFNNGLFGFTGPADLHKITPGFGDGIEYARTLAIAPGIHDGVPASDVEFVVQVRLDGATTDDVTDLTIDGVTELIDNVPPSVGNSIFTGGNGVLVTGDDFEAGIDASDGSGSLEVTADLSRLGHGDSVSIPQHPGDTWLLDTEQIQEAANSDQVSLSQDRSIVFTVTDAAGNVTVYDSAADSQIRTVDNVSPAAPELVALQRATDFDNALDLFDLVITDGSDPVAQDGSPLLDEEGQPITYADLMAGGVFNVFWSASGQPFELLTSMNYNGDGFLVQHDLPFAEFAEGDPLEFQVEAIKSSTLAGEAASDSLVIQRGVVEADVLSPEDGHVVGNGPELELSDVVAQPVATVADYAVEQYFRAYFRDVGDPDYMQFLGLVAEPDGTFVQEEYPSADDFLAAGFGFEVDMTIRPTFVVNDVSLRLLAPGLAFQNNPVIRLNIDPDLKPDGLFHDRFEEQSP